MNGQNGEYITIPFLDIEAKYVGEIYGPAIGEAVLGDGVLSKMNFPRIKYPGLKKLAYTSNDYLTIARNIINNYIEVMARKEEDETNPAKYISVDKEDGFFLFNESVCETPKLEVKRFLHEFTHAIQDWKKSNNSLLDSEVDAHFAEALYMANGGISYEDENNKVMNTFLPVAKEFVLNKGKEGGERENKKLLRASEEAFRQVIFTHYEHMSKNQALSEDKNFNKKEFKKNFRKGYRWDGFTAVKTHFQ